MSRHDHAKEVTWRRIRGLGGLATDAAAAAQWLAQAGVDPSARRGRSALRWRAAALILDVTALVAAWAAAGVVAGDPSGLAVGEPYPLAYCALMMTLLATRGLYSSAAGADTLHALGAVVRVAAHAGLFVIAGRAIIEGTAADVEAMLLLTGASVPALWTARAALGLSRRRARRAATDGLRTLIIGAGRIGRLTAQRLLDHPELGLRPIGFLDSDPLQEDPAPLPLPVLDSEHRLAEVVAEYGIEHIVVAFATTTDEYLLWSLRRCHEQRVEISVVPRLFEISGQRLTVRHLGGLPLVQAAASSSNWRLQLKYLCDRVLAALLLLATAPILLLAAAAIALTMGRPVLFRQRRVGRDGREFDLLKLRTMRQDVSSAELPTPLQGLAPGLTPENDRRTPLGAFLRRWSLDELPQLINVVRGEMSLIGPRPERPEFVQLFETCVPRYADRHRVKCGITGWAQVNGLRGQTSICDRVEWDNFYIDHYSARLDLKILLMTLVILVRGNGEDLPVREERDRRRWPSQRAPRPPVAR